MAREKKMQLNEGVTRLNRIKPATNAVFNIFFLILALVCFLPIVFIFIISITDNDVIRRQGLYAVPIQRFVARLYLQGDRDRRE